MYDESSKSILKFDQYGSFRDSFYIEEIIPKILNIHGQNIEIVDKNGLKVALISQNGILGEIFLIENTDSYFKNASKNGMIYKLYMDRIEKIVSDD